MANTYTQLLIQLVFAVRGRQSLITENKRIDVEKYICGIINNYKSKPLAIYCNPDHCHVLIGLHPSISVSEIARVIKANSSKWINESQLIKGKFSWQEGFGAFTYSRSQLDVVARYILNQPEHHKKVSFKDEYLGLLDQFQIDFDGQYLFEWAE